MEGNLSTEKMIEAMKKMEDAAGKLRGIKILIMSKETQCILERDTQADKNNINSICGSYGKTPIYHPEDVLICGNIGFKQHDEKLLSQLITACEEGVVCPACGGKGEVFRMMIPGYVCCQLCNGTGSLKSDKMQAAVKAARGPNETR